jgi:hypothetical protein
MRPKVPPQLYIVVAGKMAPQFHHHPASRKRIPDVRVTDAFWTRVLKTQRSYLLYHRLATGNSR